MCPRSRFRRISRARRWLCALALLVPLALHAQEAAPADEYQPRTGDGWIDRALVDINAYAARYPDSFVDEVARYLDVPRDYAQAMLGQPDWRAGDIHFACALAKVIARPCRDVVRAWSRDHAEGWRGVAKAFDVRPGFMEYKRVREAIRASYAHWSRPLPE